MIRNFRLKVSYILFRQDDIKTIKDTREFVILIWKNSTESSAATPSIKEMFVTNTFKRFFFQ